MTRLDFYGSSDYANQKIVETFKKDPRLSSKEWDLFEQGFSDESFEATAVVVDDVVVAIVVQAANCDCEWEDEISDSPFDAIERVFEMFKKTTESRVLRIK